MHGKIQELAKRYSVPQDEKITRRVERLQRMADWYKKKIEDAEPHNQGLFKTFVGALNYAITVIKMYRKQTEELEALANEPASLLQFDLHPVAMSGQYAVNVYVKGLVQGQKLFASHRAALAFISDMCREDKTLEEVFRQS